jgi:DNA polymerase epsilon subunit 2
MWKKDGGGVIVDGEAEGLKNILKILESCMSGGKATANKSLSRQTSFALEGGKSLDSPVSRPGLDSQNSFGMSSLDVAEQEQEEDTVKDPREWIKIIGAFEQPHLLYNVQKKHFEKYGPFTANCFSID